MKAEELFKIKAEVAKGLDDLGVDYPKIKSGANEGKPTQTFKELCALYDLSVKKEVSEKPKFRKKPLVFNPMTFRFN